MPDSRGDLLTGDAGGIQPVNVWLGYAAPMFKNVLPFLEVNTFAATTSTVAYSPTYAAASLAGMKVVV